MTAIIESLKISSSPYINAALSVLVFVLIAKGAGMFVNKVLKIIAHFTKTDIADRIIDLIHKLVFYTILIIGIVSALSYLAFAPGTAFYRNGFLYTILTLIWCVCIIRISNSAIEHAINKVSDATGLSKDIVPLVENVSKIVILIAALMVILSLWRVDITPLLASAGIAGAAVAFAAKDTIANFFGGISVFIDKPFTLGDYIVLDKGERGEVVSIGVRSTRIKTGDDILITIPNSLIANTKIINESAPTPNFRVRIPISVAYGSDIDIIEKILLNIASKNENVLPAPRPMVRFRQFGDSSLNLEFLCWAKEPAIKGLVIHQLNCAIYNNFNEAGVKIPFPQRDVYLHQT